MRFIDNFKFNKFINFFIQDDKAYNEFENRFKNNKSDRDNQNDKININDKTTNDF